MMEVIDITDEQFDRLSRVIKDTVGVNLGSHKKELLKNRLRKRVKTLGLENFGEYYRYIMDHDSEGREIANMSSAITTNVTSFFRESDHFDFLHDKLLPRIASQKRSSGNKRIRCWSAGCSTGQEAYTIAITLYRFIAGEPGWDVKILATDVSHRVVEIATDAVYKAESVEKLDRMLVKENFLRGDGKMQGFVKVKKHLRELVSVRHLNLMDDKLPFRGPFDFIFCRNVLIYFDKPTQKKVLDKFHSMLGPGGHLFLGHSEGLAGGHDGFKYAAPAVYIKV